MHCDCFRNGTRLEEITENRYTTIGNDSFVYLQMFGHNIGGVWRRGFDDTLRLPREEYHHNNWTELLVQSDLSAVISSKINLVFWNIGLHVCPKAVDLQKIHEHLLSLSTSVWFMETFRSTKVTCLSAPHKASIFPTRLDGWARNDTWDGRHHLKGVPNLFLVYRFIRRICVTEKTESDFCQVHRNS